MGKVKKEARGGYTRWGKKRYSKRLEDIDRTHEESKRKSQSQAENDADDFFDSIDNDEYED